MKIAEVGKLLNISQEDINKIKREKIKLKFLLPITLLFIGVSSLLGYILAKLLKEPISVCVNCEEYPFASGLFLLPTIRNKKVAFLIGVISLLSFYITYTLTPQPIFSYGIRYNVYSMKQ